MIPTHKRFPVIVVDYTRAPHLAPRDDLRPVNGIALALVGGLLIWAGIAAVMWNVWGRP